MKRKPEQLSKAHSLSGDGGGGTCQEKERKRPSEEHSLPGDGRGRDFSGHEKKATEQGVLTLWRKQRERFVRTQKATKREALTN